MKAYMLLAIIPLFASFGVSAQDSWRIVVNNRLIINSRVSNEQVNVKMLKSTDWKSNGNLLVEYKEARKSNWKHSLRFTDENAVDMLVKDSALNAKIPLKTLRALYRNKKQVKVYMIIAPPDPMMAAPVRMIHLGTLKLP
jgi:hypothetical protein